MSIQFVSVTDISNHLTSASDMLSSFLWVPFLVFLAVGLFKAYIFIFLEDKPSATPERQVKRVNLLESFPVDESIEDESSAMGSTTDTVPVDQSSADLPTPKIDLNKSHSV